MSNCKKYCIIRTPVLYSKLSKIHDNAVSLIGKNVMDLRNIKKQEDNYCIRRPLYISDLCMFIYDCIVNNTGIYHFYNPYNKYTKYDICTKIGQYLDIQIEHIVPTNQKSNGIAPRPYDTQLTDDKYDIANYQFTNFNESLKECFEKFKHPKINIKNKNELFICLDMDSTIIETNMAHYNAYKKVFDKFDKDFVDIDEWTNIIKKDNIDNYLKRVFNTPDTIYNIKKEKLEYLKEETITFTKNSEFFLKMLLEHNFNFCIVTNANKKTVELFKEKLPLLNKITKWIYREDSLLPKPDGECYEVAKKKYYKNEKYTIGFEDSMVGYNSLKKHTDLIYIYDNEEIFKNNDCYLFDDFIRLIC
jgi:HAD superfamily hydrolase (TIGR01509 family)